MPHIYNAQVMRQRLLQKTPAPRAELNLHHEFMTWHDAHVPHEKKKEPSRKNGTHEKTTRPHRVRGLGSVCLSVCARRSPTSVLRDAVALGAEAADARAALVSWRIARKGVRKGVRKGRWWSRSDEEPSGLCGEPSPNCTVCPASHFTPSCVCNLSSASCAPT